MKILQVPDGIEEITAYEKDGNIVKYCVYNDVCYVNAHCEGDKYTRGMFKAFMALDKQYEIIITWLPFQYLVDFYEKHSILTHIEDDIYKIKRRV